MSEAVNGAVPGAVSGAAAEVVPGAAAEAVSTVHRDRVVAVISAFRPDEALASHCEALLAQVRQVIVVDDGSGESAEPLLARLESAGVTVLRQPENRGIAAAMNCGIAAAGEAREQALGLPDPEFVVTFDQDSSVPSGFVDALVDEHDRLSGIGLRVGMVAPEFFSLTPQTRMEQSRGFLEAYAPIQSGLLMPLSVTDELGPQREDYFIDLVDTEYYLRARRAGYEAICVPGLTLPHGFGHRLHVYLLGRRLAKRDGAPRVVAVSSPFRYYYRARNRVVLNREYRKDLGVGPLLRRDALNDVVLDYGVAIWSAKGKFALLSLMLAGAFDGMRGRLGKMRPALARRAARVSWKHPAI